MKANAQTNFELIIELRRDMEWIKRTIIAVFIAIILNIIINLMSKVS